MTARRGFRVFIAPEFGVAIFWLVAIALVIAAAAAAAAGNMTGALVSMAVIFCVRLVLEAFSVLFQIHDVLIDIRTALAQPRDAQAAADQAEQSRRRRALAESVRIRNVAPGENRMDGL